MRKKVNRRGKATTFAATARRWFDVGIIKLGWATRWLWARLSLLVRTLRSGPTPFMAVDEERSAETKPAKRAEPALPAGVVDERGLPVPPTPAGPGIAPTSRWNKLDRALGTGRERWRNLLTAAAAAAAVLVAASAIWSFGDEPAQENGWTADGLVSPGAMNAAPRMGLDSATYAFEDSDLAAASAADRAVAPVPTRRVADEELAAALEPMGAGVPSTVGVAAADPVPETAPVETEAVAPVAAASATPAPAVAELVDDEPVVAAAPPATPVAEPAPVAEPEKVAEPEEAVAALSPDELKKLRRKAGCGKGTLPTEVLPGDTVQTIAWRHAGDEARRLVPHILSANRRLKPERMQPGDIVCVPKVERVIVGYQQESYKIRKGDTISTLAARYDHLSRANIRALTARARKKDMLFAGAEVRLPMPRYAGL